jgi:hypothetical protein
MRDRFPEFVANVEARLEAGRAAYGDRPFSRAPAELAGEVEEELLDVCAWAFILWARVRRLRRMTEGAP